MDAFLEAISEGVGKAPHTVRWEAFVVGGVGPFTFYFEWMVDTPFMEEEIVENVYTAIREHTFPLNADQAPWFNKVTVIDSIGNVAISVPQPCTPLLEDFPGDFPQTDINVNRSDGPPLTTIHFYGNVTGGESKGYPPYSYKWMFGDGEVSYEQNPFHRYTAAGLYQVQLTIYKSDGLVGDYKYVYIDIREGIPNGNGNGVPAVNNTWVWVGISLVAIVVTVGAVSKIKR